MRFMATYFSLTQLLTAVVKTDDGTDLMLYSKTYEDMAREYAMGAKRRDLLYELMQPEFQRTFASLTATRRLRMRRTRKLRICWRTCRTI